VIFVNFVERLEGEVEAPLIPSVDALISAHPDWYVEEPGTFLEPLKLNRFKVIYIFYCVYILICQSFLIDTMLPAEV